MISVAVDVAAKHGVAVDGEYTTSPFVSFTFLNDATLSKEHHMAMFNHQKGGMEIESLKDAINVTGLTKELWNAANADANTIAFHASRHGTVSFFF